MTGVSLQYETESNSYSSEITMINVLTNTRKLDTYMILTRLRHDFVSRTCHVKSEGKTVTQCILQ